MLSVPFRPQAVVFDLDGLLLDSEPVWAAAEAQVVESFGHTWRPEVQQLLLGRGPDDTAAALAAYLGGADPAAVMRALRAASEAQLGHGVPLRPGAASLVAGLAGRLPLGVATNSRRAFAELALDASALTDRFDAIVTAEDVAHPKPAPDPYRLACERLGAAPSRGIAFEDSPVGVASAVAAGLWVVGCPSFAGERLDEAHAVVASLTEVDPWAMLAAA